MNAAAASGVRSSATASDSAVTPCAMPSSASYSGATNVGIPPLRTMPSTSEAWELRWATTRAPIGAVGLGRQRLGALVRRRRRPEVDALDVLRDVDGQRAVAEREAQRRVGARPALVSRDV